MIEKADKSDLDSLLSFDSTGFLPEDVLLHLTESVLDKVLNNEYLTEHNLQQILRFKDLNSEIWQRVFHHKSVRHTQDDHSKSSQKLELR